MHLIPFALFAVALAGFLLSTRQFPLAPRVFIWLFATALLVAAGWLASQASDQLDLMTLLLKHPAILFDALRGNWATVDNAITPMFAVFLVIALLIALACFIAFTPGEAIERAIRPLNIALIGAVAGGMLALTIAGLGLGGAVKREVYVGRVLDADIIDGDTFRMGDVSLRIWGIDAPESRQPCSPPNDAISCGATARWQFADLLRGQLVVCVKPNGATGELRESFGRPLVTCKRQGDRLDVGEEMIRIGCADIFRDNGNVKSRYKLPPSGAPRLCPAFESPEAFREGRGAPTARLSPPQPGPTPGR